MINELNVNEYGHSEVKRKIKALKGIPFNIQMNSQKMSRNFCLFFLCDEGFMGRTDSSPLKYIT